jgi:hypothetical protein
MRVVEAPATDGGLALDDPGLRARMGTAARQHAAAGTCPDQVGVDLTHNASRNGASSTARIDDKNCAA